MTFSAAHCEHSATVLGGHALTETVLVIALSVVGLKCSFHFCMSFSVIYLICGCEVKHFFVNGRYREAKNVVLCVFFVERCCF